ncbi:UvrD-helicase domain-containing protein [Dehalobacter sp. TBBPA1]|uniref:UvrD-helicase domain-containing protein n=1 Tax=Dehalobacter sp. TBBPA1 TaxID=3235037 RepID=UPI0034A31CBC
MSFYETEAGKASIELVSYWISWKKFKIDFYLKVLAKRFINGFSKESEIEQFLLNVIKENLSSHKWKDLPNILTDAYNYINSNDIQVWIEELHTKRQIEFTTWQERRTLNKSIFQINHQKEETINAKQKGELEDLLNSDFLTSKPLWVKLYPDLVNSFNQISMEYVIDWFEKQRWKIPDKEQAQCIAEVWDNVQVIARAGSGKTSTTVNRAAFLVKHCKVDPSEILLLAFNTEAAKEINLRLQGLLGESTTPQAMTFHALAHSLVHPEEALIFDDEASGFKKSSTVQQVIDSYIRDDKWSKKIEKLMLNYFRSCWDDIEKGGYNLEPEEMIKYRRSLPYVGLDGIYYKSKGEKLIADYFFELNIPYKYEKNFWWNGLNYKPDFTIPLENNELSGIVIEFLGLIGDREYDKQTERKREFWRSKSDYLYLEIYPAQIDLNLPIAKEIGPHLNKFGYGLKKLTDQDIWHRIKDRAVDEFSSTVSQFIGKCRQKMIQPNDLTDIVKRQSNLSELQIEFLRVAWKIYQEYLETLAMNQEEDFDGLLMRAEKLVKSGNTSWQRRSGSGNLKSLRYLFIDEYQDFSLLFYQLVSAIKFVNPGIKLFCVGDDWQAINGFAGSDLCYFKDFLGYFPDAKQHIISTNYRSSRNIINVGNALMLGEGAPSKYGKSNKENKLESGDVWITHIDQFMPNDLEKEIYNGDTITPALIRIVYALIKEGKKVAILCRRKNGLPWYTTYESGRGKYLKQLKKAIIKALPEEYRTKLVDINTVHSYKGKEEDAIIIVDAVARSYPLIHPNNIFFEVLGQTKEILISEEKRLFYVALSRAKHTLVIVSESNNQSPYLKENIAKKITLKSLNLNYLECPPRDGTHLKVSIYNNNNKNGTLEIKSYLLENKFRWSPAEKAWIKHFPVKEFSEKKLLNESWIVKAKNISISVTDEFDNHILRIEIEDEKVNITYKSSTPSFS